MLLEAAEVAQVGPKLKEVLAALDDEEVAAFVETVCSLPSLVTNSVPIIKSVMEELAKDLADNQATVSSLKEAVKLLEAKTAQLMAEREEYRSTVLLGESAYILDEVAADFVFRSDKRPHSCSIGTLRNLAMDQELTEVQMRRWQQFKTYMMGQGWTIADLVGKSGELRTQRYPHAHGSMKQKEAVTPDMVKLWVNKYYGPNDSMHSLIELISKFTLPNKALCKNPRSMEVIENKAKENPEEN